MATKETKKNIYFEEINNEISLEVLLENHRFKFDSANTKNIPFEYNPFSIKERNYRKATNYLSIILNEVKEKGFEVFKLLENNIYSDNDILDCIEKYLNYFKSIEDDTFLYNNELPITEIKKHIKEYQDTINNINDEFEWDDYFEDVKLKEFEELQNELSFVNLYVLALKWLITSDSTVLEKIIYIIDEEYNQGFIFPLDPKVLWQNNYSDLLNLHVDERLVNFVIYIDYFYRTYHEYIINFLNCNKENEPVNFSIFNISTLYYEDFIEDKIDKYLDLKREESLNKNEDKENNVINVELDIDDYYEETRNLTFDESIKTGQYAYAVMIDYLNVIHLVKIILKKLKDDKNYKTLYQHLSTTLEKYVKLEYKWSTSFEEKSLITDIDQKTYDYLLKKLSTINLLLMKSVINDSLEDLLQCKNILRPIIGIFNKEIKEQYENNLTLVMVKIKEEVSKNKRYEEIYQEITNLFIKEKSFNTDYINIIKTLSTAEWLYDEYVKDTDENDNMDYSFISILYYQSLESLLNKKIFVPYSRYCEQNGINSKNSSHYFINPSHYGKNIGNYFNLKKSIELGPLGFLLKDIKKCEQFKIFMIESYNCSLTSVEKLGDNIKYASKRRNSAAHTNKIDYKIAKEDKSIVFDNQSSDYKENIDNMRNLLFETINLFSAVIS